MNRISMNVKSICRLTHKRARRRNLKTPILGVEHLEPREMLTATIGLAGDTIEAAGNVEEAAKVSNGLQGGDDAVSRQLDAFKEIVQAVSPDGFGLPEQIVEIPGASDGPVLDFGLGNGEGGGLFGNPPDSSDLAGVGGEGDSSNGGLPGDAPPGGFGYGGIASYDGTNPTPATISTDEDGNEVKTTSWTVIDKNGN